MGGTHDHSGGVSTQQAFNASAENYYRTFPERLKTLLVISTAEPIYVSPHITAHLTRNAAAVRKLIEKNTRYMHENKAMGLAGGEVIDSVTLDYITVDMQQSRRTCVSKKHPQSMNLTYVFDHEMGHLLTDGPGIPARGSHHVRECAADAFAALRHLQRFGSTTDIFQNFPYDRAGSIAARTSSIHYTSAAVQKVANLQKGSTINIGSLSLQQTAAIARQIAVEYALDGQTLEKIFEAYAIARAIHNSAPQEDNSKDWARIIRAVVKTMQENKDDHDIYRAGRLYLICPEIKERINAVIEEDPSFSAIFNFMPEHERENGFILNAADALDAQRSNSVKAPARAPRND